MIRESLFQGYYVNCEIIHMGKDYTVAVYGGDTPHIGAVVMSVPRLSLTGKGIGVTSSILTGMGHKDDIIAKWFAEEIAKKTAAIVVCSCGIHVDNITSEQIKQVNKTCERLLQEVLQTVKMDNEYNEDKE